MAVLAAFQGSMELCAFEFFSELALCKVVEHQGLQRPFATSTDYYALLEFEQPDEQAMELAMGLFEHCVDQGWVLDGVVSQSVAQAESLWRLREDISETLSRWTPYKNDISVRIVAGDDGREKIQLRLDLGILQLESLRTCRKIASAGACLNKKIHLDSHFLSGRKR